MVDTDTVTEVVDGGVHPFIILPAGVGGMAAPGPMVFTEITSMCIITYMLTMQTMYTEIGVEYPVRVIIGQAELLPEQ